MSISDMIVVMNAGVVMQTGNPQEVYDNPTNLFVAKFLGTPPINVFDGIIKNRKLYIGEEPVLDLSLYRTSENSARNFPKDLVTASVQKDFEGACGEDGTKKVYSAIRPEGFILDENGPFTCCLSGVEVMGRDISVISLTMPL